MESVFGKENAHVFCLWLGRKGKMTRERNYFRIFTAKKERFRPQLWYNRRMENLKKELFDVLLAWYEENKRVLPWRGTPTPYEVWVSEIMLQQTRVETVKPYYVRWMNAFPTVFDLANAEEETVLKLWEGLGYYSRARNIHKAAKIVAKEYGGELPCEKKALEKLPGIGAYTAGAILSIAFGIAEPAVDGNVLRVVSRWKAEPFDIMKNEVRARIADELRPFMPEGKTSEFTQALFEIGALVCLPDEDYRCEACPLTAFCKAYEEGKQSLFPVKPVKRSKKEEELTVFVLRYKGKYALKKRPDKGLLAGLYELPNVVGQRTKEEAEGLFKGKATLLPDATHIFTHVVWKMKGYLIELEETPKIEDMIFASPEEVEGKYSLPSAFSAYKKYCK